MARLDQDGQSEPLIELPEEQWREIEAAIGIKEPNLPFRRRFAHHVYLVIEHIGPRAFGEVGGPHLAAVRDHLDKLTKQAQRLADTLSKLQSKAESQDKDADRALYLAVQFWSRLIHNDYPELWRAIAPQDRFADLPESWESDLQGRLSLSYFPHQGEKLALAAVSALATGSRAALKTLPVGKGGPPDDTYLDELISVLALIYAQETGKKATVTWDDYDTKYKGRFLGFVEACLPPLAPKYAQKTNSALGKAIQRAPKIMP